MNDTRTLKELLASLQDGGSHLAASGWIHVPQLAEAVVRRAAEVAINQNTGKDAMLAILADAGLEVKDE